MMITQTQNIMTHYITIGFDKPQEIIVKILSNSGLDTHGISIHHENYDIIIGSDDNGLIIEHQKHILYPLRISDFVQSVHVAYYKKFIHNLSVKNDIFCFDGLSSKLSTDKGEISLTLKEVFFLMPLLKGNILEKNHHENNDLIKKLREKLSIICLSLELDKTYTLQPRIL